MFDAKPSLNGWGGARNRRDRVSTALSLAQARSIIAAAYQAHAVGQSFNRLLTVHWEALGLTDSQAAEASGDLRKLSSDWLRTRGVEPAWAWVRENDAGDGSKGSHLHLLLHCPSSVPIGRMWRRWLRKITGKPYRRGGVHTSRIGGTLNSYDAAPAHYLANLDVVLAYVCKGVSLADATALGIEHEPGGAIIGKRAAWRQGLGKNAGPISAFPRCPSGEQPQIFVHTG
jgi:hypothetical protein